MARCKSCGDQGLIKVQYHESEGFDIAVCTCDAGKFWRRPQVLRAWLAKQGATPKQIGRLEDFSDEAKTG